MKNITELRNHLAKVYDNLGTGETAWKEAEVYANVAGKIISTVKVELEYNKFMEIKEPIGFMVADGAESE